LLEFKNNFETFVEFVNPHVCLNGGIRSIVMRLGRGCYVQDSTDTSRLTLKLRSGRSGASRI